MKIGNIDLTRDIFITAEIGNNHEGNFELAQRLIGEAARCGVHAVKFQTIRPELFVSRKNEQRYNQLKKFEFSDKQFEQLAATAKNEGTLFMSTPFDVACVHMLNPLVPAFKIASGDNNLLPLLEEVASTGKPIILSSGMSTLEEIRFSKSFIERIWREKGITQDLAILQCVVAYPTPMEQANLGAIEHMRYALECTIGYSDHTLGIEAAVLAVALGARIIEKHFTIDKNYSSFRDHQLSADPHDMKLLVQRIKEANSMVGERKKIIQEAERGNLGPVRRSVVAKRDLQAGHVLSWDDICWMRPGNGLQPGKEAVILGRPLKKAVEHGDQITREEVI